MNFFTDVTSWDCDVRAHFLYLAYGFETEYLNSIETGLQSTAEQGRNCSSSRMKIIQQQGNGAAEAPFPAVYLYGDEVRPECRAGRRPWSRRQTPCGGADQYLAASISSITPRTAPSTAPASNGTGMPASCRRSKYPIVPPALHSFR